jgi:hypothetical protein
LSNKTSDIAFLVLVYLVDLWVFQERSILKQWNTFYFTWRWHKTFVYILWRGPGCWCDQGPMLRKEVNFRLPISI